MTELLHQLIPHFPNLALLSLAVFVISFLTIVSGANEADARDASQQTQPVAAKAEIRS